MANNNTTWSKIQGAFSSAFKQLQQFFISLRDKFSTFFSKKKPPSIPPKTNESPSQTGDYKQAAPPAAPDAETARPIDSEPDLLSEIRTQILNERAKLDKAMKKLAAYKQNAALTSDTQREIDIQLQVAKNHMTTGDLTKETVDNVKAAIIWTEVLISQIQKKLQNIPQAQPTPLSPRITPPSSLVLEIERDSTNKAKEQPSTPQTIEFTAPLSEEDAQVLQDALERGGDLVTIKNPNASRMIAEQQVNLRTDPPTPSDAPSNLSPASTPPLAVETPPPPPTAVETPPPSPPPVMPTEITPEARIKQWRENFRKHAHSTDTLPGATWLVYIRVMEKALEEISKGNDQNNQLRNFLNSIETGLKMAPDPDMQLPITSVIEPGINNLKQALNWQPEAEAAKRLEKALNEHRALTSTPPATVVIPPPAHQANAAPSDPPPPYVSPENEAQARAKNVRSNKWINDIRDIEFRERLDYTQMQTLDKIKPLLTEALELPPDSEPFRLAETLEERLSNCAQGNKGVHIMGVVSVLYTLDNELKKYKQANSSSNRP